MIAEAVEERLRAMCPLWEQANSGPNRRALIDDSTQSNRGSVPIQQHYIPRFWLVGFADPATRAGKVSAVDLSGKRTTTVSTKRAATEKNFYTVTGDDNRPTVIFEDMLGRIENWAAPAFKRLARGCLGLSETERRDLALLFAAQIVRTRIHIQGVQRTVNELAHRLIMLGQHHGALPAMEGDFEVDSSHEHAVGLAFDETAFEHLSHFLFCRRWSILGASTDSDGFALPESPVIMRSDPDGGFYGSGGVGNSEQILVPVSRQYLLVMHWAEWSKDPEPSVYDLAADHVRALNIELCVRSGATTVFCHPRDARTVEGIGRSIWNPRQVGTDDFD